MSEHDEMREAVRAEYGVTVSTRLVDDRMKETYEHLGEMPRAKNSTGARVLKWAGSVAGAAAAAFLVLVGVSTANPALAANIPGMAGIVAFLRGGRTADPVVAAGGVNEFVQPVANADEQDLQVTETYFDGKTLVLGMKLTLPGAPETYRELMPQYGFTFRADGETLLPDWESDRHSEMYYWKMTRLEGDVYVGTVTLELEDANLPDSFELTVGMDALTAIDTKLMVIEDEEKGEYMEKTYPVEYSLEPFVCTIQKDESLKKVYEVGETQNGCTLERVVVTPALTEIDIHTEETGIVLQAYGDDGKLLEANSKYERSTFERQYFRTLEKDAKSVTVKFFRKENKYDPVAEFVVPVEGGYATNFGEVTQTSDDIPVVYDPPLTEDNVNGPLEMSVGRDVALGETFTPGGLLVGAKSGSIDVTFDNVRYYPNWQEAGIEERDMNLPGGYEQAPEKFTFVLLDVTLESHDAIPALTVDLENNDANAEDGTYWISSFVYPCAADGTLNVDGTGISEGAIQYFSEHGNGFSDYDHFQMNANETKTVQVGFLVPTEHLNAGNFQISCRAGNDEGDNVLVKIPAKDSE